MVVKLKNNVASTLRVQALSTDTTIYLPVGHGARFPTLGAGEYFYATIEDAAGNFEIIRATARVTDTLTVVRAAEGTTALTFPSGTAIEMRVTAASMVDTAQDAADAVGLDQFSVTATAAELNILDGATLSTAELNILDGVTSTAAELNILDGVTSTAAELNILDGATLSTAELNILDGATLSTAELNILDGVPATLTATELGYVDGVTSAIQTQLNAKQASDADLTAIAGLSSNGMIARTGAGTAAARTVTAGTGIAVTNGDGVSGNPTVAADLASQAEAEAGTDNTKVMTPLRLRNALNASGSAPVYACRAWVNFNGTGTVAIRASGNVSSITDNGVGDYTVNFTTAMQDTNYAVNGSADYSGSATNPVFAYNTVSSGAVRLQTKNSTTGNAVDNPAVSVTIFR